jgi:hypothetical protein
MCKGSNTTSTSNSPNPQALSAYSNLLNRAGNVANTPYQAYSGELVAPVNSQQQTGIGGINTNANYAQPFINQAAGYANRAAAPVSAGDIQQYLNPFTQDVVRATENQFNQQNAMQQSQLTGNAAAQGALGGDRVGVAQGTLAGQQQLAEAPVIAGLESQGYNTALQTALAEQQQLGNAAYSLGNLGVAGQNAALTGANAQVGAGSLEQQTQQQLDAALYGQFAQGQAFPYQQTQWLAGLDTGVGSQMGGTGSTTGPAPNQTAQFLGLGLAGLSFLKDGGKVRGLDSGGGIGFGGTPYGFETSYIPSMQITPGRGAPSPPGVPGQGQQPSLGQSLKDGQAIGGLFKNRGLGSSYGGINYGLGDWGDGLSGSDMASAASAGVDSGLTFDPVSGSVFRRGGAVRRPMVAGFGTGGMVHHYADGGGDDSFDDRFNAADDFRPLPQRLEGQLGLGDLAASDPNAIGANGLLVDPNTALRANMDSAYPLSGVDPANKSENNFGFDYNPIRTNANRAYGPDSGDANLPAYATTPVPAPPLAPGRDVEDVRTAGLGASPMAYADEGASHPAAGFALSPAAGRSGEDGSAGSRGGLGLLSKLGIEMTPNLRQGLLAAGLGMMASHSPFLGTAVGEGGLQGLSAYQGAEKQEEAKKKTEADIEHGRKQLEQAATIAQKRIEMETKKLAEQAEDRRENRALRMQVLEQGRTPPGYERVENGLRALPGGPADPEAAAKLAGAKKGATGVQLPDEAWASNGDEFLKYLPASDREFIKKVAGYEIDPKTLSVVGGHRENALKMASQYDPAFDQKTYNQRYQAVQRFTTGKQGDTVRSLNVAVEHLGTLKELTTALNNGDVQALNRINNYLTTQLGAPAVTNFNTGKQVIADEVLKAVLGSGAGSQDDRQQLQAQFAAANSPAQLMGAIGTAEKLMAGQVKGLRQQYEFATGAHNFDNMLTPATRRQLQGLESVPGGAAAPATPAAKPATVRQNGHTYQLQPDGNYKAID